MDVIGLVALIGGAAYVWYVYGDQIKAWLKSKKDAE